ncbi:hypothetical protein CHGG_03252 [Chaetomium globosum CBS 148.51]|uniref:Uncharacterized protein n=1 Tax=Chaetomium globosum (strain ATCC 6205 / CBS 148.51 / DSM 1962 / NBRC 6347 / NRRL 1970) TaxID=306901 RepID=Q2H952_CHAGB|nr:uncharacterized protein CHGG_03252 [Chaetomium globosum CBS 148.51]EAQ91317.1 hypothetical protein CHGG_03252 [Chaetomium globosum CBS 148.51]
MSQPPITTALRVWYKWKALRLPWRRRFLVGLDLNGNTYWEFLDRGVPIPPRDRNPNPHNPPPSTSTPSSPNTPPIRWRRMVVCPPGTHQGSVNPPPAWHQWLRHTRADPPSLAEQRGEVARQARMRVLAAEADARWEAKPRVAGDGVADGIQQQKEGRLMGVRVPPLDTERRVGPGSKVLAEEGKQHGGGKLGDDEVVERREETWKRMRQEAGSEGGGEGGKKSTAEKVKGPDPWKQARGGPSEQWQPKGWEPAAKGKK